MIKFIPKEGECIDYSLFLQNMFKLSAEKNKAGFFLDFNDFIQKLITFCKKNKVEQPSTFISRILVSLGTQQLSVD